MVAENYLRMEMTSNPDAVGMGRLAVAHFAGSLGFSMAEIEELKVAVSEAVTNAVVHGYPEAIGIIRINLTELEGGLSVEVVDEGVGIADIRRAREPNYSQDPERMGLGFVFMESFTDQLQVQSEPARGTRVLMVKMREEQEKEEAQ